MASTSPPASARAAAEPATPPRCVVVFGGTFDPPHRAHIQLPALVLDALDADLLMYVPAGRSPFKQGHAQSTPQHRLAMLRLALRGVPRVCIDTGEIDRGDDRPSYTIDTLERLADRYGPATRLRLLLGTDQLAVFDQWKRADDIARLAPLCVMVRPPITRPELERRLAHDAPGYLRDAVTLIDAPLMDISSTTLRRRVRDGRAIQDWVTDEVARYIAEHALYR